MSFGIVVDYAAHVLHAFMSLEGTRQERAATALVDMGAGINLFISSWSGPCCLSLTP